MVNKLLKTFASIFFIVAVTSCTSTKILQEPASISKHKNAMFWELNAIDKNGNSSTVYVLGTIHVGDERLYPLPEDITDAYINADKIVGEIATSDFENLIAETLKRQNAAHTREVKRIEETHNTWTDFLTPDQLSLAKSLVGGENNFAPFISTEPWVFLSSVLTSIPIVFSELDPSQGYDFVFMDNCKNAGRVIEGLDSISTQLDILEFGDWNTQINMVKDSLNELIKTIADPGKDLKDLYQAYLTADENVLNDLMTNQLSKNNYSYSAEYEKQLFLNRNKDWANKFANYLNEGGTTFVFAGIGHFVGEKSVFEFMKEAKTLAD